MTAGVLDMKDVALAGCAPRPLAGYLKALGVLRLVTEQADAEARGRWEREVFVLSSRLDQRELEQFFREMYRPTPLVAPWGGRSGFYPGRSESTARKALYAITESSLDRVDDFRETIATVRTILDDLGFDDEKAKDEDKRALMRACRARLPDQIVAWLDACYLLTDESAKYPPLLGTGGNEGSGSYVAGFACQVVECLIKRRHDHALPAALFGTSAAGTASGQTPGQFAPLAAGGPNATAGVSGKTTLNPWDYLLCLEGTLLFAAAATRRLEGAGQTGLSFPFTVRTSGSGSGGIALADENGARAEMWAPLWDRPASLDELLAILGEGRVRVGRQTARDGLGFARAVASLGVDRGIAEFQRYGMLQRAGRNVVAVPLERIAVRRHPAAGMIDDLDKNNWLYRFRQLGRTNASASTASLVRRLEDGIFDLLAGKHDSRRIRLVLSILGEAQLYLARSPAARDKCPPVPLLRSAWVTEADDGDPAFRLAAALAGLHAVRREGERQSAVLTMATHIAPVEPHRRRTWLEGGSRTVVWRRGAIEDNLRAVIDRRMLDAVRLGLQDHPFAGRTSAPAAAVAAWLAGDVTGDDVARILPGLTLAYMPDRLRGRGDAEGLPLEAAYAVLKPFFCTAGQLAGAGLLPRAAAAERSGAALRLPREIVRLLAADRVDAALRLAERRLQGAGMPVLPGIAAGSTPGPRLLATLLVPLSNYDLRRCVRRVLRPSRERREETVQPQHEE